jgi:hypothetical protein
MYSQPKRIEFLDSIRGLAALFVLLSHTIGAFAWPASFFAMARWPFISILFDGKAAVAMFFVLSGYVLAKPYVEIVPAPTQDFSANILSAPVHPHLASVVFRLCRQHFCPKVSVLAAGNPAAHHKMA